jgi:hypothetical protein
MIICLKNNKIAQLSASVWTRVCSRVRVLDEEEGR